MKEKAKASDSSDAKITKEPIPEAKPIPGMFPLGKIAIKKTVLIGEIVGYHLSEDKKTMSYIVSYEEEGIKHERGFTHDQLEEVK